GLGAGLGDAGGGGRGLGGQLENVGQRPQRLLGHLLLGSVDAMIARLDAVRGAEAGERRHAASIVARIAQRSRATSPWRRSSSPGMAASKGAPSRLTRMLSRLPSPRRQR